VRDQLTVTNGVRTLSNIVVYASGAGETNRDTITGAAQIFAATNSASANLAELYVQSEDGTETIISPHALDAPDYLYDKSGEMKEMVWREVNPYKSDGVVSFLNARRLAKITELNTKAILFLAGQTSQNHSNALEKLKALTNQERQILVNESFAEYNQRTGSNRQPRNWEQVEAARQAAYDAERAFALAEYDRLSATNAILTASGDTNLVELPVVPPVKDVRRSKPAWLK
jgi:hypothetical protein